MATGSKRLPGRAGSGSLPGVKVKGGPEGIGHQGNGSGTGVGSVQRLWVKDTGSQVHLTKINGV